MTRSGAPGDAEVGNTASGQNRDDLDRESQFTEFVARNEPTLRRAFVAAYGGQRGREATAEAMAFAWENWDRLSEVGNVAGYLYRVGQSRTRHRRPPFDLVPSHPEEAQFEPGLLPALASLSLRQRTAVVLVHGFGWTLREVAELTGVKVTTVQNHLERGLAKLRRHLEGGTP
jgi:DNA-directed RNA polymerase specialized sigma24 family protein